MIKRSIDFLLTLIVIIFASFLCVNVSANDNANVDTSTAIGENILSIVPNVDNYSILSNDSLTFALTNITVPMYRYELNNIYSTGMEPITTAYTFNRDFYDDEAEDAQEEFEADILRWEENYNVDFVAKNATPTKKYNCHTYAWYGDCDWYGTPSVKYCWISDPKDFFVDVHCDYISDDINDDAVQEGDIVYYHSDTTGAVHSSIIASITYIDGQKIVRLESKFGDYGVYNHSFDANDHIYDYDFYEIYRYSQGEHFLSIDEYNGENGHTIKCTAEKSVNGVNKTCSYTTECTSTATCISYNPSQHYVSCSACGCSGYFYHNYYVYADNGEDGYTIKCYDCPYTIDCGHSVEYEIDGDMCHNITCMDCNYSAFEVHTYEQTGEYNSSGHEIECIYCYYSEYVDHDLYMYSAETEDYTVKCRDCNYSVRCVESPEYYGDSDYGHSVSCPDGCYSFYEPHTPESYEDIGESSHEVVCADCGYTYYEDHNYGDCYHTASANYHYYECVDCGYTYAEAHTLRRVTSGDLYTHIVECTVCDYDSTESHTWVSYGTGYRCSACKMLSDSPPIIMSLPDPELEAYLASLSEEELEEFIASLPEDQVARVTALLPSDDEHLTE